MEDNKIQEQNPKKKKTDIKTTLRNFLALVLVAVISVVATLAYLSTLSDKEVNTFTGSKGIKVKLEEPNYDKDEAGNYTPGKEIAKNPVLTNTTTEDNDATEWVAILVTYQYDENGNIGGKTELASYSDILKVIEPIDYNIATGAAMTSTSQAAIAAEECWADITQSIPDYDRDKYAVYMYCKTLAQGETTTPALFDKIVIKDEQTLKGSVLGFYDSANDKWKLPEFNIIVQGAAIKNEYTKKDSTEVATKLSDLSDADQAQLKKDLETVFKNNGLLPS